MAEYSEQVNLSVRSANKANNTELKQRLGNVSNNHVEVLRDIEKKVPEQARKGIQNAIEKSQRNQRELGLPEPAQNRGKPEPDTGNPGRFKRPSGKAPDQITGNAFEKPSAPGLR